MEEPAPKRFLEIEPSTIEAINPMRHPMSSLSIDVRESDGDAPEDESTRLTGQQIENWSTFSPPPATFSWTAPNIRYQPLYFEHVPLERYGQTQGPLREAVRGTVHFYGSLFLLPLHATVDHPRSCDYPLGFCRPGNPTKQVRQFCWWRR